MALNDTDPMATDPSYASATTSDTDPSEMAAAREGGIEPTFKVDESQRDVVDRVLRGIAKERKPPKIPLSVASDSAGREAASFYAPPGTLNTSADTRTAQPAVVLDITDQVTAPMTLAAAPASASGLRSVDALTPPNASVPEPGPRVSEVTTVADHRSRKVGPLAPLAVAVVVCGALLWAFAGRGSSGPSSTPAQAEAAGSNPASALTPASLTVAGTVDAPPPSGLIADAPDVRAIEAPRSSVDAPPAPAPSPSVTAKSAPTAHGPSAAPPRSSASPRPIPAGTHDVSLEM